MRTYVLCRPSGTIQPANFGAVVAEWCVQERQLQDVVAQHQPECGSAPNLYGQHAIYTLNQFDRYASGVRSGGPMNRIAAMMTASQRKAVAAYLAGTP